MKLALALALLLALVACGRDRTPPASTGPTGNPDAGIDDASATDGTTVTDEATVRPPMGTGEIGDPCTRDEDCGVVPDAVCFLTIGGGPVPEISFPNGFCSKGCGQPADPRNPSGGPPADECGLEAACITLASAGTGGGGIGGSSFSYCAPPCRDNSECRPDEGYQCNLVFGFGGCGPSDSDVPGTRP